PDAGGEQVEVEQFGADRRPDEQHQRVRDAADERQQQRERADPGQDVAEAASVGDAYGRPGAPVLSRTWHHHSLLTFSVPAGRVLSPLTGPNRSGSLCFG